MPQTAVQEAGDTGKLAELPQTANAEDDAVEEEEGKQVTALYQFNYAAFTRCRKLMI